MAGGITKPVSAGASTGEPAAGIAALLGVRTAADIVLDANRDFVVESSDATTEDPALPAFGLRSDYVVAGRVVEGASGLADNVDHLVAYGRLGDRFRWLVDFTGDGQADNSFAEAVAFAGNGVPVLGNFDGQAANGDEVGLFTGNRWYFDTDHDFQLSDETAVSSGLVGRPVVGDFDGDGVEDLATWQAAQSQLQLSLSGDLHGGLAAALAQGRVEMTRSFRFDASLPPRGFQDRLLAGDLDGDRIDDLAIWSPGTTNLVMASGGTWHVLRSRGDSLAAHAANAAADPNGFEIHSQTVRGEPLVGRFSCRPDSAGENDCDRISSQGNDRIRSGSAGGRTLCRQRGVCPATRGANCGSSRMRRNTFPGRVCGAGPFAALAPRATACCSARR